MVCSNMHLKSKPIVIKTPMCLLLKHFASDQKNSIFLQVSVGTLYGDFYTHFK